jgi:hypothetical protein
MPHLLTLAKNGFGIWPFSEGWPRVVEIYPRALTGPVNKGKWSARHDYLVEHFPEQPRDLLERAAGSEDAFDAAVSADLGCAASRGRRHRFVLWGGKDSNLRPTDYESAALTN